MKKLSYLLVAALLIIPMGVFAATSTNILTLEASNDKTTINYNGTVDASTTAVMCKLFDSNNNELDMLSLAVEDSKFKGSFTVSNNGEYVVSCAKYEGGEVKTANVSVSDIKVPNTGDNFISYVVISLIACLGIGLTVATKKKKFN